MDSNVENFANLDIRVGQILSAEVFKEAKKPAYILKIDFGTNVGLKYTSAQITNYSLKELIGRQVVAVCNLPSKKVAGFTSEVLILGAVSGKNVHLLRPDIRLENGTLIG